MRIADFLTPSAIAADLGASNKPGVLRELVGLVLKEAPSLDPNELVETLLRREKIQSTGIGDGVAIPHGKINGPDDIIACFGRSVEGVDFQSLDGSPTYLFFTLLMPESKQQLHLKALARISRLFRNPDIRAALMEAPDAEALYKVLMDADAAL